MLRAWLAPQDLRWFFAEHLHQRPLACPGVARGTARDLRWETLDALLGAEPSPDLLCVARGVLRDEATPRSLAAARGLLDRGIGFVLRHADRRLPTLATLARSFAADLPGLMNVQIFATAAGTHGFGWHYDFEDVFLVQTEGVKDYYFRANTVDPVSAVGSQPDFSLIAQERSPLATARLVPGDWLYIPARWWHVALPAADSLSISLGVFPDLVAGGLASQQRPAPRDGPPLSVPKLSGPFLRLGAQGR